MYKVGDLVYRPYIPQKPGKVIKTFEPIFNEETKRLECQVVVHPQTGRKMYGAVIVRWLDGTETYEASTSLNNFAKLIEDHHRRLTKHESKLPALLAL